MLHPVQTAFWEPWRPVRFLHAGMVMSVVALLNENANPTDHEIREALEGNICRCTGYQNIVRAVRSAAQTMSAGTEAPAAEVTA